MANGATRLTWTPGSAPTSSTTWTVSFWIKRSLLADEQWVMCAEQGDTGNNFTALYFAANDTLIWREEVSGSDVAALKTNRVFRDISAWYHIVLKWDTTNGTAGDRMKMFINGVEEGSTGGYSTDTQPSSSIASEWGQQEYQGICQQILSGSAAHGFSGVLAHFHYTDGTAYDASTFGETNSTSGIWVPKTSPSVSYGTNGFFLKFQDASNFGDDSSGNGNDLTSEGTGVTKTKDTPNNNYATGNSVYNMVGGTFSNGNNTIVGAGNWFTLASTLGVDSGKWYAEFKLSAGTNSHVGVCGDYKINQQTAGDYGFGSNYGNPSIGLHQSGNIYVNTSGPGSSFSGGQSTGDIIGLALDMDNRKAYWHKNGEWATGSGAWDSTTFDAAVGAQTLDVGDYASADIWFMGCSGNSSTQQANWGNGYFGTTAVSSAGTSSSGDTSVWEYDCPTGFYGLNTKNLGSYS